MASDLKPLLARLGWRPEMTAVAIDPPANYAELVDAAPIATAEEAPATGTYGFRSQAAARQAGLAAGDDGRRHRPPRQLRRAGRRRAHRYGRRGAGDRDIWLPISSRCSPGWAGGRR